MAPQVREFQRSISQNTEKEKHGGENERTKIPEECYESCLRGEGTDFRLMLREIIEQKKHLS